MKPSFEHWAENQIKAVFGGIRKPRRGKRPFTALLTLPFLLVPLLLTGFVVADVGETLSHKAITFLRSREVQATAVPRRVVTSPKVAAFKQTSLVASKTN